MNLTLFFLNLHQLFIIFRHILTNQSSKNMANVIKLRKGLDIHLKGKAEATKFDSPKVRHFALLPSGFTGVTPKVVVKEGDKVLAGDALFVNKSFPDVKFASPVSGVVTAIQRGERRRVLAVKIDADEKQEYRDYGKAAPAKLDADGVVEKLTSSGLFGYINQLPYAISTNPSVKPKSIFVSALRDMPLAADFEIELKGNEEDFQTGLTALSRIAKVYLGIGKHQNSNALTSAKDVEVNIFSGPCPAGNVGVQVNHLDPVNKGEVVWTVDPSAVIFFGRLFRTGKVDLTRTIAIAGSEMKSTGYVDVKVGSSISEVLSDNVSVDGRDIRVIDGNPLTGRKVSKEDYLSAHTSEITAIPEGDDVNEFAGWIMPRLKEFSTSHSYFSWLRGKNKEYDLDARIKGGERHMIMSGEYDRVLPMDIYGEYLIKAIITGDIDKQEQLGIYEISPEDFALAEFVDSSKLPLQKIVRQGLDILRKENA